MLEIRDNAIYEASGGAPSTSNVLSTTGSATYTVHGGYYPYTNWWTQPITYWQSYPVYVYTDKTAKAIQVLKTLEEEKLYKLSSVKQFIALVEKIAALL